MAGYGTLTRVSSPTIHSPFREMKMVAHLMVVTQLPGAAQGKQMVAATQRTSKTEKFLECWVDSGHNGTGMATTTGLSSFRVGTTTGHNGGVATRGAGTGLVGTRGTTITGCGTRMKPPLHSFLCTTLRGSRILTIPKVKNKLSNGVPLESPTLLQQSKRKMYHE